MIPLRSDSTLVDFYNDGLLIFLYDEANLELLTSADTDVFDEGMPEEPDEVFASLARDGTIVAFELEQDDMPALEVAVGPPLDEAELARGRWWPAQQAPISLPSGTLVIESYNNLRISSDFDDSEEPGARIELLPGDYLLTLYRIDWDALEEAGLGEDLESWGGPWHVITLTPRRAGELLEAEQPVMWLRSEDPTG